MLFVFVGNYCAIGLISFVFSHPIFCFKINKVISFLKRTFIHLEAHLAEGGDAVGLSSDEEARARRLGEILDLLDVGLGDVLDGVEELLRRVAKTVTLLSKGGTKEGTDTTDGVDGLGGEGDGSAGLGDGEVSRVNVLEDLAAIDEELVEISGGAAGSEANDSGVGEGAVEGADTSVGVLALVADAVTNDAVGELLGDKGASVLLDRSLVSEGTEGKSTDGLGLHHGAGTHLLGAGLLLVELVSSGEHRGLGLLVREVLAGASMVGGGGGAGERAVLVGGDESLMLNVDTGDDDPVGGAVLGPELKDAGDVRVVVGLGGDVAGGSEGLLVEGEGLNHIGGVLTGVQPTLLLELVIHGITETLNISLVEARGADGGEEVLERGLPLIDASVETDSDELLVDLEVLHGHTSGTEGTIDLEESVIHVAEGQGSAEDVAESGGGGGVELGAGLDVGSDGAVGGEGSAVVGHNTGSVGGGGDLGGLGGREGGGGGGLGRSTKPLPG